MVIMTHKHHILPKYKGGTDNPSNLVEVSVTQHAMFHYCNWQLWGDKRDWLAWKGLTGEVGREEIIKQLRLEGAKKGLKISHKKGPTPARVAAARKSQPLATAAALMPAALEKRRKSLRDGIDSLTPGERKERFSREQTAEILRRKSDLLRSFKSLTVQTPDGVKEVEGSLKEISALLGIEEKSVRPLIRKGKLKKLGFFLISKNLW
jgi:hypothetical protein